MKSCTECRIYKDYSDFYRNKNTKDGYSFGCKACNKERSRILYLKNKEKFNDKSRLYYINNKEKCNTINKKWRLDNLKKDANSKKLYNKKNPNIGVKSKILYVKKHRDRARISSREWAKRNLGTVRSFGSNRRSKKLKATPSWLSMFDISYIHHIFIQARELEKLDGIKRHVDHIVPLQGKYVSGLHVPWNLQILTASENCSKHNKYDIFKG